MHRVKNTVKNTLLVIGSLLVTFLFLEIGIRFIYGNPPTYKYPQVRSIFSSEYGHKFKPNQKDVYTIDKPVYINSFGFRDYEWDIPKPVNRIRIMVLGDSRSVGTALRVEDTYAKVLERKLKRLDQNIEVILTSVIGWATYNEVDFFKKEGINYQPDMVIIGFYPNDFGCRPVDYKNDLELTGDGWIDARPAWLRWLPYKYVFIIKRSALLTYVRDRVAVANLIRGKQDFTDLLLKNKIDLEQHPSIRGTYSVILEMKKICDKKNIKLILASIPPIDSFWAPKGSFGYSNHLEKFCGSNNIIFIDFTEGFRKRKDINKLYAYPWDNDLSSAGNELAASQLYDLIVRLLKK